MLDTLGHTDLSGQVYLIWACEFDGGPVCGLCEFDGEICWFDLIDYESKDRDSEVRLHQVVRLTDKQRDEEIRRHEAFVEFVGRHHDFQCNRRVPMTGNARPERYHWRYHWKYPDHEKRQGTYDGNEILGVFYENRLPRRKPGSTRKSPTNT